MVPTSRRLSAKAGSARLKVWNQAFSGNRGFCSLALGVTKRNTALTLVSGSQRFPRGLFWEPESRLDFSMRE
jgi:hypothetical protein